MIKVTESKLHWNYFLALERDLEQVSRFIEFSKGNFRTFSIELAHLLFAAAAEVDVVAKALCEILEPAKPRENIDHYRKIISVHLPQFSKERVYLDRYGLTLDPWQNWRKADVSNPLWWSSYNKVKHKRSENFDKANLNNALNALSGLLVIIFYYYRQRVIIEEGVEPRQKDITRTLQPKSTLLTLNDAYYHSNIVF